MGLKWVCLYLTPIIRKVDVAFINSLPQGNSGQVVIPAGFTPKKEP
jgi:hypothetical protein